MGATRLLPKPTDIHITTENISIQWLYYLYHNMFIYLLRRLRLSKSIRSEQTPFGL